jgi:hypothetical protein
MQNRVPKLLTNQPIGQFAEETWRDCSSLHWTPRMQGRVHISWHVLRIRWHRDSRETRTWSLASACSPLYHRLCRRVSQRHLTSRSSAYWHWGRGFMMEFVKLRKRDPKVIAACRYSASCWRHVSVISLVSSARASALPEPGCR